MIKEMKYVDVTRKWEVLYKGKYKEILFLVVSFGTHPCAYLLFDKNHYMYGKDCGQADDVVCVHGGFTFSRKGDCHQLINSLNYGDKWVLGWDYCHYGDRFGAWFVPGSENKEWKTTEIIDECRQYIDTIILRTPSLNLERNPLLDVISTEMTKSGREIFAVRSQEPSRDFICKLRFVRSLRGLTYKDIDKIKGVKVYLTKCKYCGEQFLTNSTRVELCCDECASKNNNEVTKKYMHKYMARNREKIGYSFGWYAKNRESVLLKIKEKTMKALNRSDYFICKVCGKICKYLDGYSLRSKVCNNPDCKKEYYRRKNKN